MIIAIITKVACVILPFCPNFLFSLNMGFALFIQYACSCCAKKLFKLQSENIHSPAHFDTLSVVSVWVKQSGICIINYCY